MNKNKLQTFQGLRGYAILLIFVSHCNYKLNDFGLNYCRWLGALGVSIFIIVSGYLLMYQYHDKEMPILPVLVYRRLKKFYPLHILTLIFAIPFAINVLFSEISLESWMTLGVNALLLQSWIPISSVYFSFNAVSWYLSLTVFFVVISPLTVKFLRKCSKKTVVLLMGLVIGVEFIWCAIFQEYSYAHWIIYICPPVRSLDFFVGGSVWIIKDGLTSPLQNEKQTKYIALLLFMVSALSECFIFIYSMNSDSEFLSASVWIIPNIMLILSVAMGGRHSKLIQSAFTNKAILFMGEISFEFFLLHQLVIRYVIDICKNLGISNSIWIYIGSLVLSILVSYVTNVFLKEKSGSYK